MPEKRRWLGHPQSSDGLLKAVTFGPRMNALARTCRLGATRPREGTVCHLVEQGTRIAGKRWQFRRAFNRKFELR